MSRLALYLLGAPRVELAGKPVHIGRTKAVALLSYLAVTGGVHRRDALATLLWPEYDQSAARADLVRTLSLLNSKLGKGWLVADRETMGLRQARSIDFAQHPRSPERSVGEPGERTGLGQPDSNEWQVWLDVNAFRRPLSDFEAHNYPRWRCAGR